VDVSAPVVLLAALATALATGLGALPFLLVRHPTRSWLGVSNAVAAGFMLAASAVLVWEGGERGIVATLVGGLLGVVAIGVARRLIRDHQHLEVGALRGADAAKAVLIVGVMTVHSFAEGVAVGVSFGGGDELGLFIAIAIAVHNVPEGLAISLVLVPRGTRPLAATGWSIFSSLPQPLLAVPAFLFVEAFTPFLPVGFGFAAGAMTWLVASELLPSARQTASTPAIVAVALVSYAAMMALQLVLSR
jgi:ZIP family zinc transporter